MLPVNDAITIQMDPGRKKVPTPVVKGKQESLGDGTQKQKSGVMWAMLWFERVPQIPRVGNLVPSAAM